VKCEKAKVKWAAGSGQRGMKEQQNKRQKTNGKKQQVLVSVRLSGVEAKRSINNWESGIGNRQR